MKRCIVNFSSRKNGNCSNIAAIIKEEFYKDEVDIYNLSSLTMIPCGKCKYECFHKNEDCPYYKDDCIKIYDAIINSDFTYFIVPNYCDYPCANFFIFNERSQCYFQGKPELLDKYENVMKKFIVVSNTNEDNFRRVFMYHTFMNPDILFLSAKKYHKISIQGNMMDDECARKDLICFLQYMYS